MFYSLKNKKWSNFKEFDDSLCIFSNLTIKEYDECISNFENIKFDIEFSKFLYEIRKSLHENFPFCKNWSISHFQQKFEEEDDFTKMCEISILLEKIDLEMYHPHLIKFVDSYLCQNPNWQFLIDLNYEPFNNLIDLYNSIKNKFYVILK